MKNNENLLDLISRVHKVLRQELQTEISKKIDYEISGTQAFLLNILKKEESSISNAARKIHISRQAMQKNVYKLEQLGLIEVFTHEANKKEKLIKLSTSAKKYLEISDREKRKLNKKIKSQVGEKKFEELVLLMGKLEG